MCTYRFQGIIDDLGMLKVVVGEEVELIEKVSYIYAAQGIHLRER